MHGSGRLGREQTAFEWAAPPTLWLLGDDDQSIPIRPTKLNLECAIAAGAPITVKSYAGANHGLRRADGSMAPF